MTTADFERRVLRNARDGATPAEAMLTM